MNNKLLGSNGISLHLSPQMLQDSIAGFHIDLNLKGSNSMSFAPVGETTTVNLKSSWNDPGFNGLRITSYNVCYTKLLRQAQNALADRGIDVHCTVLDVTDPTSIVAAIGKISDAYRRLDVLVNNAGIMIDGGTNILELPLRLLQNTINTNALGPLLVSQACVALMRET